MCIRDSYYTRDRSTPRLDSYYGGSSHLTGAIGWEEDGMTKIMFRKVAESGAVDPADWNFEGTLHLVWSHGQNGHEHFVTDEIKYHGHNRAYGRLSK